MSPTYSVCQEHGYLKGEQLVCPHCGKKTEVYSRITGYYRPIQNWNDGKTQEYKDRKEYDAENSMEKFECKDQERVIEEAVKAAPLEDGVFLFATTTCPNCRMAKTFLSQANIEFNEVIANDNVDLTKELGITVAPTLVVVKDGEVQKIENVSNIRAYIDQIQ